MKRLSGVLVVPLAVGLLASTGGPVAGDDSPVVPSYQVDPFWPKPLPNNWLVGQVAGVAIDSRDHIWVVHRPASLDPDETWAAETPPQALCCVPAPPVLEFDGDGNLIQAWGHDPKGYQWLEREHGIFVDHTDHVWVGGIGPKDHRVLKLRRDGTLVLELGKPGQTGGSNDKILLGRPADVAVDPETNEAYVADGYTNRRVVVFDGETGEYRRHWGAYGRRPEDAPLPPFDAAAPPSRHFKTGLENSAVHGIALSRDGLVYVADRNNNRIQVFQKDGTFVKEAFVAQGTLANGSVWDLDFSHDPQQAFVYVPDGTNQRVWILARQDLKVVGEFGRSGRSAGQFHWIHNVAVDSKGNVYTTEVQHGKRMQKFVRRVK